MASVLFTQEITNAGGTFTFDPQSWGGGDATIYLYISSAVTLGANVNVNFSSYPNLGSRVMVIQNFAADGGLNLNLNSFSIDGSGFEQWVYNSPFTYVLTTVDAAVYSKQVFFGDTPNYFTIDGDTIAVGTLDLDRISDLTSGTIPIGSAGNVATARTISGDFTISNTGVGAIAAGVIVNADVNASAAIALSKLAALTASKVAVTDGSGVITTANQLSALLGGTALDTSASTGVATVSAGTWAVGARTEVAHLNVSWNTGYVGDFKIKMPFAGTVTGIYGYIAQATVGATAGTCVAKDNAGTTMTAGTITTTAGGDARGTAYSVSPSANNTFIANDILTFTTATATAGEMQLSITYTRTS